MISMMIEPTWWKYAKFDDSGICGISDDAPDEEKQKYAEYEKNKKS